MFLLGLPCRLSGKEPVSMQETQVQSLGQEGHLGEGMAHGQRILAGYSPWSLKESDMTEATEDTRIHPFDHFVYSIDKHLLHVYYMVS